MRVLSRVSNGRVRGGCVSCGGWWDVEREEGREGVPDGEGWVVFVVQNRIRVAERDESLEKDSKGERLVFGRSVLRECVVHVEAHKAHLPHVQAPVTTFRFFGLGLGGFPGGFLGGFPGGFLGGFPGFPFGHFARVAPGSAFGPVSLSGFCIPKRI